MRWGEVGEVVVCGCVWKCVGEEYAVGGVCGWVGGCVGGSMRAGVWVWCGCCTQWVGGHGSVESGWLGVVGGCVGVWVRGCLGW